MINYYIGTITNDQLFVLCKKQKCILLYAY